MDLNEGILQTASNVVLSVQVAVDPKSDNAARQEANKFYEDFRSQGNPLTVCAVGFALSSRSEHHVILAGLQLIEYVAKFKWNTLEERQTVKDRLLQLMHSGVNSGSASWPAYVQEGLSKVIVEIAKREWPQLWPNLFPTLFEIANVSDLPFFVLRRMAEDVVTLQLVDCSERRRELIQSLNAIAPEVIRTLFTVLISSVQEYNKSRSESMKRRGKVCLGCLLPYIEWLNPLTFTEENRLPVLFALLLEEEFQMEAADCLIQLLERKPLKKEDRFVVSKICLDGDCCNPLIGSIDQYSENLDFIRKAGEIITLIAPNVMKEKVNVENFLNCTLKLSSKSNAVAVLGSALAINQYLKANNSSSDLTNTSDGQALICLLNSICNKFVSAPPDPSEKEELSRLRTEFSQMLRSTGKRLPKLYKEVNSWLHSSLSSPNAVQMYQWETLVLVIDAVASSISHEDKEMVDIGLRDLEQCYQKFKEETVLELKSIILSTVSALFVFLALAKQAGSFGEAHMTLMHSILQSVFYCFTYENVPYARDIRRHAAALMIKLSTRHPDLLALGFDFIHGGTTSLISSLSSMEYTTLMESLMITSNCWNDPAKQSKFIQSLLDPMEWNKISTASESPQTFVPALQEALLQDTRILFIKNLTLLHSIIRRIKKPAKSNGVLQQSHSLQNHENATNFGGSESENFHPAYDLVCPLLPVILKIVKTVHSLMDDPQLMFLNDLSETERSHVMGIHLNGGAQTAAGEPIPASIIGSEVEKSYPDKLRVFIQSLVDLTYGILGGAPALFTPKFYHMPQVGTAYLSFVGWNNSKLIDFRLRGVVRSVYTPFLLNCPAGQVENIVKPFLQNFAPFMFERLVSRWMAIENSDASGDDAEEKEVLENTSLRLLSKDYIELLHKLLESRTSTTNGSLQSEGGDGMNDDLGDSISTSQAHQSQALPDQAGDCGLLLLSDPICFQSIIHLCVNALCWDDSNVSLKAARCILLSLSKLVNEVDLVRSTFGAILRALCMWYEHEATLDSLLKVLDGIFKVRYASDATLRQLLKEWGAPDQDVQKLIALCNGPKNEKKRKDVYRKMVLNNPALEKNRSPKAQWLRGLPQLNLSKSKDSKLATPEIDLSECFSIIHHA